MQLLAESNPHVAALVAIGPAVAERLERACLLLALAQLDDADYQQVCRDILAASRPIDRRDVYDGVPRARLELACRLALARKR